MKKEVAGYSLVLVIGFAAGWLAHAMLSTQSKVAAPITTTKPSNFDSNQASTPGLSEHDSANQTQTGMDKPELNKAETAIKDTISDFSELLSLLETGTRQDLVKRFNSIFPLFGDEEFTEQLLENYLSNNNPQTKDRLRMVIKNAMWMSQKESFMESAILAKMQSDGNLSEWLGLLSEIGVSNEASVEFLSEQMSQLYEEQDIAAAIGAVSKNPFWMGSQIERGLQEKLKSQIGQYVDSTSPDMRKAVLASLGHFPRDDGENLILNAMDDPSNDIRESAYQSASRSGILSDPLKNKLLQSMQDEGQTTKIRELSYSALLRYKLENENYDALRDFRQRMEEQYAEREE